MSSSGEVSSSTGKRRRFKNGRTKVKKILTGKPIAEESIRKARFENTRGRQPIRLIGEHDGFAFHLKEEGAMNDSKGKNLYQTILFTSPAHKEYTDQDVYLRDVSRDIERALEIKKKENPEYAMKTHISVSVSLLKLEKDAVNNTQEEKERIESFRSAVFNIFDEHGIKGQVVEAMEEIKERIQSYLANGSGWKVVKMVESMLDYAFYYIPIGGSYIKTPHLLAKKKCTLNIEVSDDRCFEWSLLAYHYSDLVEERNQRLKEERKINKDVKGSHKSKQRSSTYLPFITPGDEDYCKNHQPFVWSDEQYTINFPVSIEDVEHFERMNPEYSINVLGYLEGKRKDNETEESTPGQKIIIRTSHTGIRTHVVNLLMLEERSFDGKKSKQTNSHYCFINNVNKFLGGDLQHRGKMYYCMSDFLSFHSEEDLKNHQLYDCRNKGVEEVYPDEEDAWCEYVRFDTKQETPFYIVADLESINTAVKKCSCCREIKLDREVQRIEKGLDHANICVKCWKMFNGNSDHLISTYPAKEEQTITTHEQRACSAAFYVVNTFRPQMNRSIWLDVAKTDDTVDDLGKRFVDKLFEVGGEIMTEVEGAYQPLDLTREENAEFIMATQCHICEESFDEKKLQSRLWFKRMMKANEPTPIDDSMSDAMKLEISKINTRKAFKRSQMTAEKVRDHCHFTGQFRGAAHRCCNLNFTPKNKRWKIPLFFHNMKNYDGHFMLQWLKDKEKQLIRRQKVEDFEREEKESIESDGKWLQENGNVFDSDGEEVEIEDTREKKKKRKRRQNKNHINAIPLNREKFLTITLGDFRIVDSFSFFSSSLRSLTENLMGRSNETIRDIKHLKETLNLLPLDQEELRSIVKKKLVVLEEKFEKGEAEGRERFTFLKQEWKRDICNTVDPENEEEAFKLLFEKGHWAYEWFTSVNQLNLTELPSQDAYKLKSGKLNGVWKYKNEVNDVEYEKEKRKWEIFNMKTMRDAHDLYLKLDVVLLADILENRRKLMMRDYGKDYTWYVSLPAYAWDVLLDTGFRVSESDESEKLKKPRLQLFSKNNAGMYLFINKAIRGGMCMIPHRYAKANNPYMGAEHNTAEPNKYILYNDANQLYSWAMRQYLPYDQFSWVNLSDLERFTEDYIINYDNDENDPEQYGHILEVDLEYPQHLHDYHSDYPLAPTPLNLNLTELSPYTQKVRQELDLNYTPVTKLCSTLNEKKNYVVHYRNLKFYLKHGMRLKKVHRVLSFSQVPWIRTFIDFNVKKRQNSTNDFDKDLYKLINNAVFGKTMEDEMNRIEFKLCMNESDKDNSEYHRLVRSPLFKEITRIAYNDDLVGISSHQSTVKLSKPKACGFAILDISKTLMYQYYYEGLKPVYGDRVHLCMTDTDSLETVIETEDLYKDMENDITAPIPFLHPSCPPQQASFSQLCDFSNYSLPFKSGLNIFKEGYGLLYSQYLLNIYSTYGKEGLSLATLPNEEVVMYLPEHFDHRCYGVETLIPPQVRLFKKNPQNTKVTGKFKDEEGGGIIAEFVGLKPKCYSNKDSEGHVSNKAKGVPKQMLKQGFITHEDYVDVVFNNTTRSVTFTKLTARDHHMYFQEKTMLALTPFDSKRWVLDNINTRAFGHYRNEEKDNL